MGKTKLPAEFRRYLAELGSEGGKTAAKRMTKEQRVERARKGGRARGKKKKTG